MVDKFSTFYRTKLILFGFLGKMVLRLHQNLE